MLLKGKLAGKQHPAYLCLIKHLKLQEQVNILELTVIHI